MYRVRFWHRALCTTTIVVLLALVPASSQAASGAYDNYLAPASACPGTDVPTLLAADQITAMLCLIDYVRATRGVPPVARSPLLASSAGVKADDIMRCGDFSHTACGRSSRAPFEQTGYITSDVTWDVGENLAFGSNLLGTPRSTMRGWLESDEHRQNLFAQQWRDQGLAFRKPVALLGLTAEVLWVSHFGRRESIAGGAATSDTPTDPGDTSTASDLRLSVRPTRAISGRQTSFRFVVKSSTRAVRGATVSLASRRARTDSRGRATITTRLRRVGRARAVATKGSLRARQTVRVVKR